MNSGRRKYPKASGAMLLDFPGRTGLRSPRASSTCAVNDHYDPKEQASLWSEKEASKKRIYDYDVVVGGPIDSENSRSSARPHSTTIGLKKPLSAGIGTNGYHYDEQAVSSWPSRDPIGERGGVNLYGFVGNDGIGKWDYLGLEMPPTPVPPLPTGPNSEPSIDLNPLGPEYYPIPNDAGTWICACTILGSCCCDDPFTIEPVNGMGSYSGGYNEEQGVRSQALLLAEQDLEAQCESECSLSADEPDCDCWLDLGFPELTNNPPEFSSENP